MVGSRDAAMCNVLTSLAQATRCKLQKNTFSLSVSFHFSLSAGLLARPLQFCTIYSLASNLWIEGLGHLCLRSCLFHVVGIRRPLQHILQLIDGALNPSVSLPEPPCEVW